MLIENPRIPVSVAVPSSWLLDDSMVGRGVIVAAAPRGLSARLAANLTLIAEEIGQEEPGEAASLLEAQKTLEPFFRDSMESYRLVSLTLKEVPEGSLGGVSRVALFTSDSVPATLHQRVVRGDGVEVSLTFTYPTAETPLWYPRVEAAYSGARWRGFV